MKASVVVVVVVAAVMRCAADMPAVDVYKVRWAPVKEAAKALGGDAGVFASAAETAGRRDEAKGGEGRRVFRSPIGFTEPLNQLIRGAVSSGRAKDVDEFLRAVNAGGWIQGQLIARDGGDYTVSLEWRNEPGTGLVVEYTHRFAEGRRAVHKHIVTAHAAPGGGLAWIREAREIVIEDDWAGLSPVSPIEIDYTLRRDEAGGLGGKAAFSVGGHFKAKKQTDSAEVKIPAEAAAKFLDLLAGCATRAGEYHAAIRHTDDYPNIRITVKAADRSAIFRTESQGETHVPWGLEQAGQTRIVEGDGPARAMKAIEPFLERERRKKLVDALLEKSRGQPME